MKFTKVDCQTKGCVNEVDIIEGGTYFGIYCTECWDKKTAFLRGL